MIAELGHFALILALALALAQSAIPFAGAMRGDPRLMAVAGPAAVTNEGVTLVDLTEAELVAADAVVVLADHDSFDYALVERHARYVFDTRNRCRGQNVEAL